MTAPAMIDLLAALRALGPVVHRAREAVPVGDDRDALAHLEVARLDFLKTIERLTAPKVGTPIGDLLVEKRRFARACGHD